MKVNSPIIIALILGLAILGYGYLNYLTRMEQENIRKQELLYQKSQDNASQVRFESCIATADMNYSNRWDDACRSIGRFKDCQLPRFMFEDIDTEHLKNKEACARLWK